MIGERENTHTDTEYGALVMRSYDISGNEINAFYDSDDNLVFVLDNTISNLKPNVLLVINPDADRKWDEILSDDYDVDLETIRPKQDNKYQKLDIEYSGLNVYDNLINAYNAGDDINDLLDQLNVLRDSAARHSAMVRLTVANEIISKTNATIVKTKETIVKLTERIKTLRAKLSATKKEIGRVSTKQSASKILKLESQIEAANEKLKRAKKRLESAQKRLEVATVDAELAEELLNQPAMQSKPAPKRATKTKSVAVAPKHEVAKVEPEEDEEDTDEDIEEDEEYDEDYEGDIDDDNGVKPLLDQDPQILNENIAFKPISLDTKQTKEISKQTTPELPKPEPTPEIPQLNNVFFAPEIDKSESELVDKNINEKPVLESITPISVPELQKPETPAEIPVLNDTFFAPEITDAEPMDAKPEEKAIEKPVLDSITPINNVPELSEQETQKFDDTFVAPEYKSECDINMSENVENNQPVADINDMETRQPEPVNNENVSMPMPPAPVVDNKLVAPMTENMREELINKGSNRKPNMFYYLLLFVLIVLSVFTLWLYQKNATETTPMLTANVEKTTVLKKTDKPKKAEKPVVVDNKQEIEEDVVFFDEESTETADVEQPIVTEEVVEPKETIEPQPSEPVIMDAVPARVGTSVSEETEDVDSEIDEEAILANKPVYEPGARHNEMFIVPDGDVSDADMFGEDEEYINVIDNDTVEETVYVDEENPFYDTEEEVEVYEE